MTGHSLVLFLPRKLIIPVFLLHYSLHISNQKLHSKVKGTLNLPSDKKQPKSEYWSQLMCSLRETGLVQGRDQGKVGDTRNVKGKFDYAYLLDIKQYFYLRNRTFYLKA